MENTSRERVDASTAAEAEVVRLKTALREVIELSEGGGPAAQRLAQIRRRARVALDDLDRLPG